LGTRFKINTDRRSAMSKAKSTKKAQTDKPAPPAAHPCACSFYEVEIGDDAETMEYQSTGCDGQTRSTFCQGHDARLKSLLIKAGIAGHAVRYEENGMTVVTDALTAAAPYGFASKVASGIERGRAKVARETRHEAATAAPEPTVVRIKVGRWVYEAVLADDGSASYTTAGGAVKVVAAERIVPADEEA
jgi:hypothetical protein